MPQKIKNRTILRFSNSSSRYLLKKKKKKKTEVNEMLEFHAQAALFPKRQDVDTT